MDEAQIAGDGLASGAGRYRAAELRDQAADSRDVAADVRDIAGENRDLSADRRDEDAQARDRSDEEHDARHRPNPEASSQPESSDRRRLLAASDRASAADDREAGADDRVNAELDRVHALADRGASASDRQHASIDGLTGVYRRDPGMFELDREIARAHRTAHTLVVAFVDVDGLKAINDAHGHPAGDLLLLEVAESLKAALRPYDLIVRFGGDEFVCAISGIEIISARKRFALVNEVLADAASPSSVTVGLAQLRPGDSRRTLVARADAELYEVRRQRHSGSGS